ncbi:MAG: hypothetical protein JWM36_2001 [Hyphomicrobiales bacterium]|nr:hypothetical protein [Hyphomicrobiales bacterium]MDB5595040.1 hypothetical protein [Hyphomicrobiales bacterium]
MHHFKLADDLKGRVADRVGREHPFDTLLPERTALVVIDMQNYFLKPGYMGEVPMARQIVPGVNQLAAALRRMGGHVVWIMNSTNDTRESWSVFHEFLLSPEKQSLRYETLAEEHEGHELWPMLDVKAEDAQIVKKRFSAFVQGSSDIAAHLRQRGIDTVLIAGTATNVCCESSARDAMMLNFRTLMVSDACATYTDAEHAASLSAFYAIFGDVQTIDETIASLARGARLAAA